MIKVGFFQKNQLGIGLLVRKCAEIGQKWDFRALFSEIQLSIEQFFKFETFMFKGLRGKVVMAFKSNSYCF